MLEIVSQVNHPQQGTLEAAMKVLNIYYSEAKEFMGGLIILASPINFFDLGVSPAGDSFSGIYLLY